MANNVKIRNSKRAALVDQDVLSYLETLEWHLYVNDITPAPGTGTGQFTDCTDSGVVPDTSTFGAPTLNGSNQGQAVMTPVVYTLTHSPGDYTIYGVYGADPADSDEWVVAWRGATPLVVVAAGQIARIDLTWLLDQLT